MKVVQSIHVECNSNMAEIHPKIPVAPVPSPNPDNSPRLLPRQRPVVVIDPGHGGPDPAAVGIGGIYEKDIVLPLFGHINERNLE
jgi:N-acetylmuramoyl-L-alanine amidase